MNQYDNNFINEYDLVECLNRGCEVEFLYNEKKYSITHTKNGVSITEFNIEDSERTFPNGCEALEYRIGNKKLKDIIPDMKIIDRSF